MKSSLKIILTLLLVAIFAAACGAEATPTVEDVNALVTAGVGTMVASFFETQTAMVTPATITPVATLTPLPTFTPYPTGASLPLPSPTFIFYTATFSVPTSGLPTVTGTLPTATVNSSALANGCNNLAFIRDVTIPAGTVLKPNEQFTKIWKVQNTGSCDWMFQYSLVWLSGEALGDSGERIQRQVTVWDWSELSVDMTAPKKPGTYASYWRLADGGGTMFGATLVVSIVVSE